MLIRLKLGVSAFSRLLTHLSNLLVHPNGMTESYLPQRFWREGWSFKKTLQKVIRYKYHNLN